MDTLAQFLSDIVGLPVVPTKDPAHGDYQWNGAFKMAKEQGKPPRQLAESAADLFRTSACFAKVEVAGPGFVNLTLDDEWLARRVASIGCDGYLGVPQEGQGHTVVVDHSSPNVAKRMHVGHLRSTVIGAAIARLLRATGHHVVTDNHVGDWGTQFGKLIVAWRHWADIENFAVDPVGELERLYVLFNKAEDIQLEGIAQNFLEDAKAATLALQQGNPACVALWEKFVEASMREYQAVYDRLGVTFDVTLGESAYKDDVGPLVERLLANGSAVESEGAVVVPAGPGVPPFLVRKGDGASLYGTTDLAAVEHRMATWQPQQIIYVTDVRQNLHFRQLFWVAGSALHLDGEVDLVHVGFGMLRLPEAADDQAVMSSRAGNTVPLVALLDEARDRALAVVTEKNPDLPEAERLAIAEAVGVSAVVYADLSRDPTSDVTFEWDRVLSLEGNTAPYLLYALARLRGILRKAQGARIGQLVLRTPEERAIALALVRYPDAVAESARACRPNVLAEHLYGLARLVGPFYLNCPVTSPDGAVDGSRLGLVAATADVLDAGFRILGLRPLGRM